MESSAKFHKQTHYLQQVHANNKPLFFVLDLSRFHVNRGFENLLSMFLYLGQTIICS